MTGLRKLSKIGESFTDILNNDLLQVSNTCFSSLLHMCVQWTLLQIDGLECAFGRFQTLGELTGLEGFLYLVTQIQMVK